MPNGPKRAILYCRVSTSKQEDGTSLDTQEENMRLRCVEKDYRVVHVERDVHTGADLDGREGLNRVREMVRRGETDVLMVWKLDRLSRDMRHQVIIIYEVERAGVTVESFKEEFEQTLEGNLMRTIVGYVAEVERQNITMRTAAGIKRSIENGKSWASTPAYGYMYSEDRSVLLLDEEKAPYVRLIFEMLADGESLREVVRALKRLGVPSPKGNASWNPATIATMVRNPIYHGKPRGLRYKTRHVTSISRTTGKAYAGIAYDIGDGIPLPECDPIVSEEIAKKALISATSRGNIPARVHPVGMLDNLLICGDCGAKMRKNHHKRCTVYRCFRSNGDPTSHCTTSIEASRIDKGTWERVVAELKDIENLQEAIHQHNTPPPAPETLQAQKRDLEGKKRRLMDALATEDDLDIRADIRVDLKALNPVLQEVTERLAGLAAAISEYEEERQAIMRVVDRSGRLAQGEELTETQKRDVLKALRVRVVVLKDKIRLPTTKPGAAWGRDFRVQVWAKELRHSTVHSTLVLYTDECNGLTLPLPKIAHLQGHPPFIP